MPTPSTGALSMQDVQNETGINTKMYDFFAISQVGGGGGLMYHNLGMGPSNVQTAKQAVYDPFVAGTTGGPQNLPLGAWYNYSQTPNGRLNMTFTNNNTNFDIVCTIYLTDPTSAFSQAVYTTPTLTAAGGNDVQVNYDTGLPMDTTRFTSNIYYIEMSCTAAVTFPPPPFPPYPAINTTVGATPTDTDGVGAGTVRNRNAGIPPFDDLTPLNQIWIVRGNITGVNGIYINKRTTFDVTFA